MFASMPRAGLSWGWLLVPKREGAPLPAITMAHGYVGTGYHGLEPMAEGFAEAGFVVLLQ
jgi:cephalosporin-C deacetylase-like acetyl esterase